ncbi:MAG: PHP domain-containing protein [Planctomycetota bacterium]|jgi:predicted metal-dependent phosphoesterase TrpH
MRRFVDLHTHSTASDGMAAPREVIRLAEAKRLLAVALTDHDTADGLAEARAAAAGCPALCFVPGIEFSAQPPSGTLHILGLGVDGSSPPLLELSAFLRGAREERNPKIVAKLQQLGVGVDMEDVRAAAAACGAEGKVISRLHVAEALRLNGCVKTVAEAFERYLRRGAPAYAERSRPNARRAIAAIRAAGGVAVLAHPVQLNCSDRRRLQAIVSKLADAGLEAVEVYHSDHTPEQTRLYLDMAGQLGLEVAGGSDFHGAAKPGVTVGQPKVPLAALGRKLAERLLGTCRGT